MPVIAPYPVILAACKYRVKLTPGPLKKGKAGQAALRLWSAQAAAGGMAFLRGRRRTFDVTIQPAVRCFPAFAPRAR